MSDHPAPPAVWILPETHTFLIPSRMLGCAALLGGGERLGEWHTGLPQGMKRRKTPPTTLQAPSGGWTLIPQCAVTSTHTQNQCPQAPRAHSQGPQEWAFQRWLCAWARNQSDYLSLGGTSQITNRSAQHCSRDSETEAQDSARCSARWREVV